jgi:hypothetical protein
MWTYDQSVKPPAPFIDVVISHSEDTAQTINVRAIIDTAADVSAIPMTLVDQLELPITKKLMVKGYDDVPTSVFTYSVLLEVSQVQFRNLRVIATPRAYVILGRDVLNHFYIQLNGPELTFDVSLSSI